MAIHVLSEQAMANTILRFEREGRGATIEALARIQGYFPNGLRQIKAHYGGEVRFTVVETRDIMVVEQKGWEALSLVESEGNYEHIKQKLTHSLEAQYAAGLITRAAYEQAAGQGAPTLD